MTIIRVRTPETIDKLSVRELVLRAVEATHYPGTSPKALLEELAARIKEDGLGVFVGLEEECPRALCVVMLPASRLMMAPQIVLVYSEGSPALIRRLAVKVREWIRKAGFGRALGINLYRGDAVFMRGFGHFGKPAKLGSLIEFDLS